MRTYGQALQCKLATKSVMIESVFFIGFMSYCEQIILKNMGGGHLVPVKMVVGGLMSNFFYIVWGPLKKVRSSPPL